MSFGPNWALPNCGTERFILTAFTLTAGADVFPGISDDISGDDVILGLGGHDIIQGGTGADFVDGGLQADIVKGGAGNDELHTGLTTGTGRAQEADELYGGSGDDLLVIDGTSLVSARHTYVGAVFSGGAGNDILAIVNQSAITDLTAANLNGIESIRYATISSYALYLTGAQMNDLTNFDLNLGRIEIKTADTIVLDGNCSLASITLFEGGQSIDLSASTRLLSDFGPSVFGGKGIDNIIGSDRRDTLSGGGRGDVLDGRSGNDTLAGGNGEDQIQGGDGDDVIKGGGAFDLMHGGLGKDIFDYDAVSDSLDVVGERDGIVDFVVTGGLSTSFTDRFDFSTIDAKAGGLSNDTFDFIGVEEFTAEGQVRAVQVGADTYIELNISGTSGAEMSIFLANFTATWFTEYDFFP